MEMPMSAAVIQPSPISMLNPIQKQNEQQPGYLSQIGHFAGKVLEIIREKGCLTIYAINAVFCRCVSWLSPTLANRLETLCLYVVGAFQQIKFALIEDELREEIRELKERNQHLNTRIQTVLAQSDVLSISNDRSLWEKNQVIEERDLVRGEREELILGRAPILIERDQLRRENQTLLQERNAAQNKNGQLNQEKIEAVREKEEMKTEYHQALEDLGHARLQLAKRDDLQELNQKLSRFQELYIQTVQEEKNNGASQSNGATQMALHTLIPQYQKHRGKLHEMLQTAIDELPVTDLSRIPLKGILRLSTEEMGHIEQISQSLHLFKELRKPIALSIQGTEKTASYNFSKNKRALI
jgi:hypothetical protein